MLRFCMLSLRLRQPDFLVLLLPGIHIVVQRFGDNILQEDAFHPITINGKKVKTLTYDTDAITVGMFADAEARKLRATSNKGGGSAGACELDYSLHAYLAMMAIVAVNSDIDVSDLERISGPDVMELMRIGRNFTTARSAAQSEESGSESSSETTLEPSTPQSASSDGNA